MFLGRELLIYIGGTIRWIYGSIWRTLFKKSKFTFEEYIHGPKNGSHYDKHGHEFNNKIIAFIAILVLIGILAK